MGIIERCIKSPSGACYSIEKPSGVCRILECGRENKNEHSIKEIKNNTPEHVAVIRIILPAAAFPDIKSSNFLTGIGYFLNVVKRLKWVVDFTIASGYDDDNPF